MEKRTAYLLLGGNLGHVQETFSAARSQIEKQAGHIRCTSSVYRSEPWGFHADSHFLNQALALETNLPAGDLLASLLDIETRLGRVRKTNQGYASRTIDVDILLIGDEIWALPELVVPHPGLAGRRFALTALAEIAKNEVHPILKQTIEELLRRCTDRSPVEKIARSPAAVS